jgi:phospholipase C
MRKPILLFVCILVLAFLIAFITTLSTPRLPVSQASVTTDSPLPVDTPYPTAPSQFHGVPPEPYATSVQPSAPRGSILSPSPTASNLVGIHKIQHVIVIMQENRTFDHYFGTYPGADGIPMKSGVPTVCVPDPATKQCVKPFHDPHDENLGGPHGERAAVMDIDGGKMDGFIAQEEEGHGVSCTKIEDPACAENRVQPDVMGWHDAREIPNYWMYAQNFVLQDRMFEPNASWSLPAHLFMVSGWSANCKSQDPESCVNALQDPDPQYSETGKLLPPHAPTYAWTDLTYLLYQNNISWAYYVANGTQPDCEDDAMFCLPKPQQAGTPNLMNPLPWFVTVHQDKQVGNIQTLDHFYAAAKDGKLPSVAWIVPNGATSEHPPASITAGQAYVTGLINALMQGPDWNNTAIFLAWDDWGGFYDHVVPPTVDQNGYGLRVPGLLISPYAKTGYIDHQALSFDAYLKFIEDDFLNGQRIDPKTDGRPDPRPDVRENMPQLGDLSNDFDFNQEPRSPLILQTNPPPGPASIPGS